jgi:cystine transport system ATP-binding protein
VADEVLFFDDGVIVERGAPKDLFTRPTEERTRRFVDRLLRPFED